MQSGERRNAENLSETVPASARVMQRFLTESPWDDDTVIGRDLTPDEVQHFTDTARRIAAILGL